MYISRFARGMHKTISNFYKGDAQELQITETERDKQVGETSIYCGSTPESETKCCKAMKK